MKLILKIILLIICLGLLISCANNVDLSTIFNHDKTTSNNTTNNDIGNDTELYCHNIRIYYDISSNDNLDYSEDCQTFDFSFSVINDSPDLLISPSLMYDASSNWISINMFDGLITFDSTEYSITGIICYPAGISVQFNYHGNDIYYNLMNDNYEITDIVSYSVVNN